MKNTVLFLPAILLLTYSSYPEKDLFPKPSVSPPQIRYLPNPPSLPHLHPMKKYKEFMVGAIDYNSTLKPEAWLQLRQSTPNLGNLVKAGETLKMIAFGGGLTAGVCNGGYYLEGQLFAYPNLVARQMNVDFQSPLFNEAEKNGTGFMVYNDSKAQFPRWAEVQSNLAEIKDGILPSFNPYSGPSIDNFAYPEGGASTVVSKFCYHCSTASWKNYQPYVWRIFPEEENKKSDLLEYVQNTKPYNFVLIEDYFDSWMQNLSSYSQYGMEFSIEYRSKSMEANALIERIIKTGAKGVIFTIPQYKDLPFFNWYSSDYVRGKNAKLNITYTRDGNEKQLDMNKPFFFWPTPAVDAIFQNIKNGETVTVKLTDKDVIDFGEFVNSDPEQFYNPQIRMWAEKYGLALVDLSQIYTDIKKGTYYTEDGLKLEGGMNGNFYSSDGIYPSALGQAIIANEVIKAVNKTYGAKIPSIKVIEFAKTIGLN